jgi:signal transduction histidine kinase
VQDNGSGIPEHLKEKIFDPFYSTKEGGTGLGLSISRKIVESYGGSLKLTDAETEGACFTIFLPESGGALKKQTGSEFKNNEDNL